MSASAGSAGMDEPRRARRDLRAVLWGACVLLALGALARAWARGPELETSVLAMLPRSEQDPALHELTQQLSGRASHTLVILVGHPEREQALAAAAHCEQALRDSRQFSSLGGALDPETERAFFDLYFPHRHGMLSARLRGLLEAGAGAPELVQRVRGLLQGPTSSLYSGLLERDPLLLYADAVQGWAEANPGAGAQDGFVLLEREGSTWA